MTEPSPFVIVDDYEPVARAALPPDVWGYFAGGAGDEWTLAENRRAFDRWMLRPRFLRGAGEPDTSTSVLGDAAVVPGDGGAVGLSATSLTPTAKLATAAPPRPPAPS